MKAPGVPTSGTRRAAVKRAPPADGGTQCPHCHEGVPAARGGLPAHLRRVHQMGVKPSAAAVDAAIAKYRPKGIGRKAQTRSLLRRGLL